MAIPDSKIKLCNIDVNIREAIHAHKFFYSEYKKDIQKLDMTFYEI